MGEWDDYTTQVSNDKNYIALFFDFFEGKMNFDEQDIKNVCSGLMFSGFQSISGFLDFYLKIYSGYQGCLESKNDMQDYILNRIINKYVQSISRFLLSVGNEVKYNFFISRLIDCLSRYEYTEILDFSNIVKFLNQKTNLDENLKNKLLKKIDEDIVKKIERSLAKYYYDCFEYPIDFETDLNYVADIMKSKDVLPDTRKKIYDVTKKTYKQNQQEWQLVLYCKKMKTANKTGENSSTDEDNLNNQLDSGMDNLRKNQLETNQHQIENLSSQINNLNK